MNTPLNIAILLSGGGTTFQYIQDQIEAGKLDAKVLVVLSSNKNALGLERAARHAIPSAAFDRKELTAVHGASHVIEALNDGMIAELEKYPVDLVVCAGFMSFLSKRFIHTFRNRIINTHPALIPAFSGQDCYGHHVHKAALNYGVKLAGCTIHFVDEEYDHGAIIAQRAVPVLDDDTPETLGARVQAAEKPLFCEVIQAFAEKRVVLEGRKVKISGSKLAD